MEDKIKESEKGFISSTKINPNKFKFEIYQKKPWCLIATTYSVSEALRFLSDL